MNIEDPLRSKQTASGAAARIFPMSICGWNDHPIGSECPSAKLPVRGQIRELTQPKHVRRRESRAHLITVDAHHLPHEKRRRVVAVGDRPRRIDRDGPTVAQ